MSFITPHQFRSKRELGYYINFPMEEIVPGFRCLFVGVDFTHEYNINVCTMHYPTSHLFLEKNYYMIWNHHITKVSINLHVTHNLVFQLTRKNSKTPITYHVIDNWVHKIRAETRWHVACGAKWSLCGEAWQRGLY